MPTTDEDELLKPSNVVYEFILAISDEDCVNLRDGMTGRVKMTYKNLTLGRTFKDWVLKNFQKDFWL